jgi:hypothetical protein
MMAVVTGVRNFVRLMGSTFALAVAGSIVNNYLRSTLHDLALSDDVVATLLDDPTSINGAALAGRLSSEQREAIIAGYTRGFHVVFYMTVACQAIAFIVSFLLIGQHELIRADDKEIKERTKEMLRARKEKRKEKRGEVDIEAASPTVDEKDEKH